MANHRRKHLRGRDTRERSSEWRYPQIEKGASPRARASTKRRTLAAQQEVLLWLSPTPAAC